MIPFQSVRMDLMSSKDVAKYLKKNDMVILPVGCFEMHGPRIPLACDTFLDLASVYLLAEKWKCLVAPPIHYTYPGASAPWPGTVTISPEATQAYIKAVALGLLKAGFKRVVISGEHGPLDAIIKPVTWSIFEETGTIMAHLNCIPVVMPEDLMKEEFGFSWREDLYLLGSLKLLGLEGVYNPVQNVQKDIEYPFKVIRELRKFGGASQVPWIFKADHQHTGINKGMKYSDADRIIKVMKKAVARAGDFPKYLGQYQKEVAQVMKKKPWKSKKVWSL